MKPRLERALKALKKAYNNGKLEANHCKKCAVGTIVASYGTFGGNGGEWYIAVSCPEHCSSETSLNQIKATGYTLKQLTLIEERFESASLVEYGNDSNSTVYNEAKGLIAVIKVLCKIDRIPAEERDQIIKDFGL